MWLIRGFKRWAVEPALYVELLQHTIAIKLVNFSESVPKFEILNTSIKHYNNQETLQNFMDKDQTTSFIVNSILVAHPGCKIRRSQDFENILL